MSTATIPAGLKAASTRPAFAAVVRGALADFACAWRSLALTDLAYKAFAFAVLTPSAALLLRWLLTRSGSKVVADADIARFFLTTPEGIVAILLGSAITISISAVEAACLMAAGLAASRQRTIHFKDALLFGATRSLAVLRLTANMIIRLIAGLAPFLAAAGAVYLGLLRGADINYYLARRPPEFLAAAAIVGLLVIALVVLAVRTVTRWAMAFPLMLFDDVPPRRALQESAARSDGSGALIALVLASWSAMAMVLGGAGTWLVHLLARTVAPLFAGSASLLIIFLAALALLWGFLALAIGIVDFALFSLLVVRLWLHTAASAGVKLPEFREVAEPQRLLSTRMRYAAAGIMALLAIGFALLAFLVTRGNEKVVVLAHRGSSASAPENTLAAFRLAVAERADYVELDVQESKDGVVLVVHDSDLMKIGGSPMKIWEHTAAELRSVDIGSHKGSQFRTERVATLEEALSVVKGSGSKMMIELKSYGHGQQLEQRVIDIVERAQMANRCEFMSLDHAMVTRMKALRPSWRTGVLIAKAVGDPMKLPGDFLAVETRMATPRFIRRAHAGRRDVYVWTVDDPAWMLAAASRGADGLITNKPAVARQVMERRAGMSDAQRFLVAMLVRSGARIETLEAESALRP